MQSYHTNDQVRFTVWPITLTWEDDIIHAISLVYDRDETSLILTHGDGSDHEFNAPILNLVKPRINDGRVNLSQPLAYPSRPNQIRASDHACSIWSILTALYYMNARDMFPKTVDQARRPLRRFMTEFTMALHMMKLNPEQRQGRELVLSMLHWLSYVHANFELPWE